MKNANITWKITQGMYVLTTDGGGCIVDSVSQVSGGDEPLISVAVMKKNLTNELLKKSGRFGLSVLGLESDAQTIKTFGFQSGRDVDKFSQCTLLDENGIKVIPDALGYMICNVVETIENETHTVFIGRMIEGDILNEGEPMSYGYYQAHKAEILDSGKAQKSRGFRCKLCGYVYEGDELPADYKCPICGVGADMFERL